MAIKREDLMKFSKLTELAIQLIEDDSSQDNEVQVLHLIKPVTAIGSVPVTNPADNKPMELKMTSDKVYVGKDNIDAFMADTVEQDGVLIYKGKMHLDVSKPGGRNVGDQFVITKPAKIWLTQVKFNRFGGQSRQTQAQNLGSAIASMFSGGGYTAPSAGLEGSAKAGDAKEEPKVVVNQPIVDETKNGQGKNNPKVEKTGS